MSQKRPSILSIALEAISVIIPSVLMAEVFVLGLFPTLWHMLLHPRSIPFPSHWRDSFLNTAQPFLNKTSDLILRCQKRDLISKARGRVLEVGAGTGGSIKYYDKSKIDLVYGVEPNLAAVVSLRAQLVKHSFADKYEILPFGIEETDKMAIAGVTPSSIDTIVCVFLSFKCEALMTDSLSLLSSYA